MDAHEFFTYKLYEEAKGITSLQEERGRMPNLRKILDKIVAVLSKNISKEGNYQFENVIYEPTILTFFKRCTFKSIFIRISPKDEPCKTDGCFYSNGVSMDNMVLKNLPLSISISTPLRNLEYCIKGAVGHELLHAYEQYQKLLKNKDFFDNEVSSKVYFNAAYAIKNMDEPMSSFAWALYYGYPQERRAAAQEIQSEVEALFKKHYDIGDSRLPFEYYRENIMRFHFLKAIKNMIEGAIGYYDKEVCLDSIYFLTGKKFSSMDALKSFLSHLLNKIEADYNKALERGISDCLVRKIGVMECHMDGAIETLSERKKKIKEIQKKYWN